MANLTENLADSVTHRGVKLAYGEPIRTGDSSIVPVAVVTYGFGGGDDGEGATGGGGGGAAFPVGVYETRGEETRFQPNIIALAVVAIPLVCVAGRAIARIIKAF